MKKYLSLLICVALILILSTTAFAEGVTSTSPKTSFSDVENHRTIEEICFVEEKKIMVGYLDKTFKPEKTVSRLELAVVLDRVFDFNFSAVTFLKQPELKDMFDDVYDGKWYSNSLLEATFFGILNTNDRLFKPNVDVTRIEVAKAIQQSFKAKKLTVVTTQIFPVYEDTKNLSQEETSALSFVYNTGIIMGKDDSKFAPNETLTRSELAVIIKKTMSVLELAESN